MNHPRLSVSTFFDYALPIETQIPLVAAAGFTHLSLGGKEAHSRYLSAAGRERLRTLLAQRGISIDTIHGPQAGQADSTERLAAVAEACVRLSVPVVVMHAGPFYFSREDLPERLDATLKTCSALERVAIATGVRFALENVMPGPATDLVCQALPRLNPEYFGFCYDSAHDQIDGPRPFDLLDRLKDRLMAVHLSDRVREFVDHVLPGEGFVDWSGLAAVLRTSRFQGPLLFEVSTQHSAEKDAARFLQRAHHVGSSIWGLVRSGNTGDNVADIAIKTVTQTDG